MHPCILWRYQRPREPFKQLCGHTKSFRYYIWFIFVDPGLRLNFSYALLPHSSTLVVWYPQNLVFSATCPKIRPHGALRPGSFEGHGGVFIRRSTDSSGTISRGLGGLDPPFVVLHVGPAGPRQKRKIFIVWLNKLGSKIICIAKNKRNNTISI